LAVPAMAVFRKLWFAVGIIWFGFLLLVTLTIPRYEYHVSFIDYLRHIDVSDQYTFYPSLFMYLFEPVTGFLREVILIDNGFSFLLGGYLVIRVGIWVRTKRIDESVKTPFIRLEKHLNVFGSIMGLCLLGLLGFIAIGWLIAGPLVVIMYGFSVIHGIITFLTMVLAIILGSRFVMHVFPNSWLSQRIKTLITRWDHRPRRKLYEFFDRHRIGKRFAKEFKRIAILSLFYGYLLLAGYAIPLPTRVIATDLAPDEVLFDFHVHTCRSDGWPLPAQRVEWYRSHGIQGAAFADHHSINGAMEASAYVARQGLEFTVLIAQEYSPAVPDVHMNIYGINETINPISYYPGIEFGNPLLPSLYLNVSDTIKYVKAHGGYITVNHYGKGNPAARPFSLEQLRDWGVDGFEIVNMGDEVDANLTEFCLANNLICMGGSDQHEFNYLDTVTRLRLEDPQNRSIDAIFAALRKNEHQVIAINVIKPQVTGIATLFGSFGRYFSGLDGYQRLSWWLWSGCVILIAVSFNLKIKFKEPIHHHKPKP
jgi:predicted metal-dependent phosphoesterase TrpH